MTSYLLRPYTRLALVLIIAMTTLAACGNKEKALRTGQEMRAVPVPSISSKTAVDVVWRVGIGGSNVEQPLSLTPAFSGAAVFLANSQGNVARIDLQTGKPVWRKQLDTALIGAVGVDKAIVVVASDNGDVIGLNAGDGKELWRQSIGLAISASPTVGQDRAVVRTLDGQVIAFKATTGEHVWGYQRPTSSLSMAGDAPTMLAGEGLVTGFSNGRIVANSVFTGQIFWEKRQFRPAGNNLVERLIDIDAEPTLVGQYILVGAYQGGVAALRLRDGQEVWRSPISTRRKITFDPSGAYVTGDKGSVHKLDLDTGKEIWSQASLRGHGISNPIVKDGRVYVGDLDGQLYGLDAGDGHLAGRSKVISGAVSSLHAFDGSVYAYSVQTGQFVALR